MDFWKKMRFVTLPQAVKVVLPAMGNQFVYVLKMSSLNSYNRNWRLNKKSK